MFKQSKDELTEDKVREIFQEEYKQKLEDFWRARLDTEADRWREIRLNIENIVTSQLGDIVAGQAKKIEDKLLVELVRQALSLDKDKQVDKN